MKKYISICILLLFIMPALITFCTKPYNPVVITTNYNYLVVDGFINTGRNSITTITLSRTRTLADTANVPELNAQVSIAGSKGNSYALQQVGYAGIYISTSLSLDTSQQYQLIIKTSDGNKYTSDFVSCKQTPPIDSVSWQQHNGVNIFVSTHDPDNNTHYYKWNFSETWQYHSTLQNYLGVNNGLIYYKDTTTQTYMCWYTDNSTNILLGSSIALGQDVISFAPLTTIPNDDVKINIRYSILVSQHAITADAYNYWSVIQKTSQTTGSLFDLQPTQINGNFHSVTNPGIPVIGYVSACSEQQQRIFISNDQLANWPYNNSDNEDCPTVLIPENPVNFQIYDYSDTSFAPYYFAGTGGPLVLTKKVCIDCTLHGGVSNAPSFW